MGGCYSSLFCAKGASLEEQHWCKHWEIFQDKEFRDLIEAYIAFVQAMIWIHKTYAWLQEAWRSSKGICWHWVWSEIQYRECGSKDAAEPSIKEYLDAFHFPAAAEFKVSQGCVQQHSRGNKPFLRQWWWWKACSDREDGQDIPERKSQPLKLETDVPFQEIVMKRTEKRWETTIEEMLEKAGEAKTNGKYAGKIRKEKGMHSYLTHLTAGYIRW